MSAARFAVANVGHGFDELARSMDESTVMWALQRIQIGSGKLARSKLVAIVCSGESTPPVKRGKLQALTKDALGVFAGTHVSMEITTREELSLDNVLTHVLPFFVADDGNIDVQLLKEQYEESLITARIKRNMQRMKKRLKFLSVLGCMHTDADAVAATNSDAVAATDSDAVAATMSDGVDATNDGSACEDHDHHGPKMRKAWTTTSCDCALGAVAMPRGRYNWAVLDHDLELYNAGLGGVEEMRDFLEPDQVMFAVFRMHFDKAYKHVFVHWVGPNVPAVKKGIWNSRLADAEELIRDHMAICLQMNVYELEELETEEILLELERLSNMGDRFGSVVRLNLADLTKDYYKEVVADVKRVSQTLEDTDESLPVIVEELENLVGSDEHNPLTATVDRIALPTPEDCVDAVRKVDGDWDWMIMAVQA
eukprot:TRINITY_DN10018_c0_g1_i1.p1 TRINITY_DN10018_c0_g1~~TRINITY_DN10018_c0_g1_i1.p1  ORF type:complete len:425 (-),score=87.50 TRINITY_DN10018_c0_g1_i1:223-1497(-)